MDKHQHGDNEGACGYQIEEKKDVSTDDSNLSTKVNVEISISEDTETSAGQEISQTLKGADSSHIVSQCVSDTSVDMLTTESDETNNTTQESAEESLSGDDSGSKNGLNLTDLPTEILIHISTFIESRQIISMCRVCLLMRDLFSGESYWRTRVNKRWPNKYPLIERADFSWREGCMEREEKHRTWSKPDISTDHIVFKDNFIAAVDVAHLLKGSRLLATGSRDRTLNLFDLSKYDPDQPDSVKDCPIYSDSKIHKGWVWSMASYDSILATGSWDTYVRLWDIGEGEPQLLSSLKCNSAILSLYMEPGFVVAGGYDKRLHMFDPRAPESKFYKRYHKQPILSVVADDKYVISGSEDSVISIYDRTAGKNYKKIEVENFVMDMSYGERQLWFGDKMGKLNLIDATDGLFDNIQTFDVGHKGKLSGVCHTKGAVFTCGTDNLIKVVEPSHDPGIISTLRTHSAPVARLCYRDGVLASAGSDVTVGVWIPKPGYR